MAPLEPGVAQLAFWAADDLTKAHDKRELRLLPLGIRYSWRQQRWRALDARLSALESHLGFDPLEEPAEDPITPRRDRLLRIGAHLMTALEQLERLNPPEEASLTERIEAYRLHGLATAEAHFQLKAGGTLRNAAAGLNRPPGIASTGRGRAVATPQRGLADWEAQEADLQLSRMRLVEHFTSVSGHYVGDRRTLTAWPRCCWWRKRSAGSSRPWPARPSLGPQRVELSLGDPLAVESRLPDYHRNRRRAVQDLTKALEQELSTLISPA